MFLDLLGTLIPLLGEDLVSAAPDKTCGMLMSDLVQTEAKSQQLLTNATS